MNPFLSSPSNTESTTKTGVEVIRQVCTTLPHTPGVYRMIGLDGGALYVGKAKNLLKRVKSYTQVQKLPVRLMRMVAETARMEIVTTHTEAEALLLEANLIQKLAPKYNIVFRDNKTMAFILLTQGECPGLYKHRGNRRLDGHYFGPFPSGKDLALTLTSLTRAFGVRTCSDQTFKSRKRPCLQYDLKRCTAPCVGKIGAHGYQERVAGTLEFLSGKSAHVQEELGTQMMAFSHAQDYEKAASVRDRIRALTQLQARQSIFSPEVQDGDIVGVAQQGGVLCFQMFFFRGGGNYGTKVFFPPVHSLKDLTPEELLEGFLSQFYQDITPPPLILLSLPLPDKRLLEQALSALAPYPVQIQIPRSGSKMDLVRHAQQNAQDALGRQVAERAAQEKVFSQLQAFVNAPLPLSRIEIYDNSHLQGREAYGVMVVATPEGFFKKGYRKFAIRSHLTPGDDYGMMREVFTRRFPLDAGGAAPPPDLLIIDGGKGHLRVVHDTLLTLNRGGIPVVAISKGPQRNAGRETIHFLDAPCVQLDAQDSLLYFFQRLRDEAHRFAITTHRQKRIREVRHSHLEAIAGIGRERKKMLLRHFGSLDAIKGAGVADLQGVPGISRKIAEMIYAHFQNHV